MAPPTAGKYPSPSRPARRAEASEWPPMCTGTDPAAGRGSEWQAANEEYRPSKVAGPPAHRARSTSMASSVRSARSSKGTPMASNSSRSQPIPTPRSNRPPERRSRVATSLARTTGLRWGRIRIPVASRSVVVAAAR